MAADNITRARIIKSISLLNTPITILNAPHIIPIKIIIFSFMASFMFTYCTLCHCSKNTFSDHDHYTKNTYCIHDHCRNNISTNRQIENKYDQPHHNYNTLNPNRFLDRQSNLFVPFPDTQSILVVLIWSCMLMECFLVHNIHQAVLYMVRFYRI